MNTIIDPNYKDGLFVIENPDPVLTESRGYLKLVHSQEIVYLYCYTICWCDWAKEDCPHLKPAIACSFDNEKLAESYIEYHKLEYKYGGVVITTKRNKDVTAVRMVMKDERI